MQNYDNQCNISLVRIIWSALRYLIPTGNSPANDLVTEYPQQASSFYFSLMWKNIEKYLITNKLRYDFFLFPLLILLLSFHMARHNFGSLITLSQGVPLESVCKMMGHRNISTTQLYAKLTHQKVNEDIKQISLKVKSKYELPEWNKGSDNVKNIHYGQRENGNQ